MASQKSNSMHKSIHTQLNPTFQAFYSLHYTSTFNPKFLLFFPLVAFTYILAFFCSFSCWLHIHFLVFPWQFWICSKSLLFFPLSFHIHSEFLVILFDASKYIQVFLCSFHLWCFCIHSNLWWWESPHILRKDVCAAALIWICLT